ATEKAIELGDVRVANMIALGAYQKITEVVLMEDLIKALEIIIPTHRHNLIPLNKKALQEGAKLANVS
ncbi:MAG TPA: 2-oxoacid:ferredoxin oxidoreductase subunit gamma, partial [Candidatus Omnitrophica bacterium]|nr:2-oxoacid:ferredoxin oxidoreductase subunit gamma [Candidatus Omnitrophota bacterium]